MNILFETSKLKIEHEYEFAYLVTKLTGKRLLTDDFYGDPSCGLISPNNDWAIIAGDHLAIWRKGEKAEIIDKPKLKWINDVRYKSDNTIEILIDPWSEYSAIWQLEIDTLNFTKIRDFNDYLEKEHTENIKW
jgi:hypothetical protein